jgi:hypothetical protein
MTDTWRTIPQPVTLYFTPDEMIESLERIGYTVRTEEVMEQIHRGNYFEECKTRVQLVFREGELVAPHLGRKQVEFIFERELKARMLGLFK